MTEHWHAISSGEAFQLASTLSIVLNWQSGHAAPAARWRRADPFAGDREQSLEVSFEGLTRDEQERALASFPGGRRCTLVERAAQR